MAVELKIRDFLLSEILRGESPDSLKNDDNLIDSGVLDSFAMIQIVGFLEKEFNVEVGTGDITPDNFQSVDALAHYINTKLS